MLKAIYYNQHQHVIIFVMSKFYKCTFNVNLFLDFHFCFYILILLSVHLIKIKIVFPRWSESTIWNQGALVKHSKELFKAEGISNAAEPGHSAHSRFYVRDNFFCM